MKKIDFAKPDWKWFFEAPLAPAWRRRLELALGVVLSGAAVVALSGTVRPDPAKLAARLPVIQSSAPPPGAASADDPEPHPYPSPEFRAAVDAGDASQMARTYKRGMMLDNMLATAARSGKKAAVAWLLDHGANVHEDENGAFSPVLFADDHPEIVKLLLDRGAAEPSVEMAAAANAPNAFQRALAKHPNVNARGTNALQAVAFSSLGTAESKELIVTKLLEAGADPSRDLSGMNPLAGAVASCDYVYRNETQVTGTPTSRCMGTIRVLLNHGAVVDGDVLAAALSLEDATRSEPLELILASPIDKEITSRALAAAQKVSEEDLKRLVARTGVDWSWHDGEVDAALPMLEAARRGDRDTMKAFLDAGAPVDTHFKEGVSALSVAIETSHDSGPGARIVELLVSRGANVNRRLPDGRTPLFAAAEAGELRVVNFLLEKGARVNDMVLDDTALDAAEQNGHTPAARVLHAHGARRAPRTYTPSTW